MSGFRRYAATLLFALATVAPVAPVAAQRTAGLQDAVERVQRDTGGKILSAETIHIGREKMYRIKVLTPDGRVRVVQVPAEDR